MRQRVVLVTLFLLAYTFMTMQAFQIMPQTACTLTRATRGTLEMKGKGKRVPIDQRGEYIKRQRMIDQRESMLNPQTPTTPDGKPVPVFQVFTRPKAGGLWIPVGDLQGDERSSAVVTAWMEGFLGMSDMYKGELDRGIARSVFGNDNAFAKNIIENYKPFKRYGPGDLEFGYKVKFPGLEEKFGEMKTMVVDESMQKNWLDNAKDGFSGLFGGKKEDEINLGNIQ